MKVPPAIFQIAAELPGTLWIMPCPSGETLASDIAFYQASGVGSIVSMLDTDEARMLGLASEDVLCAQVGIEFRACPIRDFGLPEIAVFDALVADIAGHIQGGARVAVHCRAGIGRSGMVCAAVLVALGSTASGAVAQVSNARGVSIPDTVEQGSFITSYADRRKQNDSVTN